MSRDVGCSPQEKGSFHGTNGDAWPSKPIDRNPWNGEKDQWPREKFLHLR